MPVLLLLNSKQAASVPLTFLDFAGVGLWLFGMVFEILADKQKLAFKQDPANDGKFISSGLWRLSRHPNYFGEILLWFGVYLVCYPALRQRGLFYALVGLIGPVSVFLFLAFASGLPMLEEQGQQRWGQDEAYKQYVSKTPVLFPFVKFFDPILEPKQAKDVKKSS